MTNKRYDSRYWSIALSIFLLALIARAGMAWWTPDEIVWDDGHRYEKVALNLLAGEGFGGFEDNSRSVPTQPVLIAAIYSVFGRDYTILRLFFAGLGALTCVLASVLGAELFGRTVGILAGFCSPYIRITFICSRYMNILNHSLFFDGLFLPIIILILRSSANPIHSDSRNLSGPWHALCTNRALVCSCAASLACCSTDYP